MTKLERIRDISKRCGHSEQICMDVLQAETDSAIDSLKKGENVTLMGRCVLSPTERSRYFNLEGVSVPFIHILAKSTGKLKSELEKCREFESSNDEELDSYNSNPNIVLKQIDKLM